MPQPPLPTPEEDRTEAERRAADAALQGFGADEPMAPPSPAERAPEPIPARFTMEPEQSKPDADEPDVSDALEQTEPEAEAERGTEPEPLPAAAVPSEPESEPAAEPEVAPEPEPAPPRFAEATPPPAEPVVDEDEDPAADAAADTISAPEGDGIGAVPAEEPDATVPARAEDAAPAPPTPEPEPEPEPEPAPEPKPAPAEPAAPKAIDPFSVEEIEAEFARLLGRSPSSDKKT